ncbi:GtrA family protein [candidate division KSB1 bacterium]|nr:GtrA family protein [candidate division KSB1 bacterium]
MIKMDSMPGSVQQFYRRFFLPKTDSIDLGRVIKYYLVAGLGAVINYGMFNILKYQGLTTTAANTLTYLHVVLVTFLLQKYYTYQVNGQFSRHLGLFIVNALIYYFLDTLMLIVLIDRFGVPPAIGKCLSIAVLSPLGYLFQKYVVFVDSHDKSIC